MLRINVRGNIDILVLYMEIIDVEEIILLR